MNLEKLTVFQIACAKAWAEENEKPGTFDNAFGDLRDAVAEAKQNKEFVTDPRCLELFQWFDDLAKKVKEQRRCRDAARRSAERRRRLRNYKQGYPIMEGGSCSGN